MLLFFVWVIIMKNVYIKCALYLRSIGAAGAGAGAAGKSAGLSTSEYGGSALVTAAVSTKMT